MLGNFSGEESECSNEDEFSCPDASSETSEETDSTDWDNSSKFVPREVSTIIGCML